MDVIRDESLLDSEVARDVTHGHQSLDADNEKPKMVHVHTDGRKTREIPTPITLDVDSYSTDYLPSFLPRHTYIRANGKTDASYVEYDLDHADLDWLKTTLNNDGQERLPPERFEQALYRLEVFNASKLDAVFQGTSERRSTAACASTDYLTKADALSMLEECGLRDATNEAIYEYWKKKRASRGKPLLRRLEAPVNYANPNPLLTFRSRSRGEARARPQTRRRRENNPDSLDKLQMIGDNIKQALDLFDLLVRRERKKRDLVYCSVERQRLMIGLEGGTIPGSKRPKGFDLPAAAPASTNKLLSFKEGKKKGWVFGEDAILNATAYLACEPVYEREYDLRVRTFDVEGLEVRVGRGGRVIVDRGAGTMGMEERDTESLSDLFVRNGNGNPLLETWGARVDLADKKLAGGSTST